MLVGMLSLTAFAEKAAPEEKEDVNKDDVVPLSMTVEEAFKVIMSAGVIVPEHGAPFQQEEHVMHEKE